jgi:prepilin-type N-terminal cleavage/methylation domain-containing protein/prepilin-type processing-associated H-X9-DG protein
LRGFTLVELLVVIAIIGVLVGMLLPAVQMAREAGRRTTCINNSKQFGLAIIQYETAHKYFPWRQGGTEAAGMNESQISGVVLLLPYLEQSPLLESIVAGPPKGGPPPGAAFQYWQTQVEFFLCPSDVSTKLGTFGNINYGFSVGDNVLSAAEGAPIIAGNAWAQSPRGVFGHNSRIRSGDLLDGTSNTIAMAERTRGIDPTYVKGGIAEVAGIDADPSLCLAAAGPNGNLAGTIVTPSWSGARWQDGRGGFMAITTILPPNAPSCTTDAANAGAPGIFTPSSQHPGGVVVLFCDGSVRLISEQIECGNSQAPNPTQLSVKSPYGVWGALGTRRGREVVDGY